MGYIHCIGKTGFIIVVVLLLIPIAASAETFLLSEKFPKSTQGENGIFLEYRQGSTYQLLDNRLDYDFPHLADSPWKIPMITCSDFVAGPPHCYRIGAHPSDYADAVLKIIIPGEGGTVRITGTAGILPGAGSVFFSIYKGEDKYTTPSWSAQNGGTFDFILPYKKGDAIFFATNAGSNAMDDRAYWDGITLNTIPASGPESSVTVISVNPTVQRDQGSAKELYVPSTALGGVKYIAASSGIYRVTYISGAARGPDVTPSGDCGHCNSGWQACWSNQIFIYQNREVYWGPAAYPECQAVPVSPDYSFGDGAHYTLQESESEAQGHFFDVSLNTGDWLVFTIVDPKNSFDTNLGGMTIKISPVQQEVPQSNTASVSSSYAATITSAPITNSPSDQVPNTNNGDLGSYLAVIIFLVIILCVGGFYSLHMIRKKHFVEVTYPNQKPSFGSTSSNTTADNATKFRPSSFENESTHHDIFISYSHEDKPIADAICASLESENIRCWIAPRDVLPGEDYPAAIINAIEACRIMVLVFSSKSNSSDHVTRELTKAVSSGAIIIPFRIEDIPLSKNMEYLIGIPHWLDALTPPLEQHIDRLVQTIKVLLAKAKKE
jgi:hypothetical protein